MMYRGAETLKVPNKVRAPLKNPHTHLGEGVRHNTGKQLCFFYHWYTCVDFSNFVRSLCNISDGYVSKRQQQVKGDLWFVLQ